MIINCNDIDIGISKSLNGLHKLKSNKLVKDLVEISNMEPKRSYMVTSMNVFNIIENHNNFEPRYLDKKNELTSINLVGSILGIDCYVDLYMKDDNILLYYDKQYARDLKIESILDGVPVKDEKIEIKVYL